MSAAIVPRVASSPIEVDRGRERFRRIGLTAAASIGFRGALMLSGFIYIPLTVRYLGPERYGLWVAMISVMTLLAFADCGLGYGLMNHVAYATGKGARDEIRKSVSTTFFVLCAVAVTGCAVFLAVKPFLPWQAAFRTRNAADAVEAARSVGVMVFSFFLTLPFTTVQRVQSAYQEGFESQLWEIGGVVLSLCSLLLAIHFEASLLVLAVIFVAGPLLALALNWLVYFFLRRPELVPSLKFLNLQLARRILHEGGYFFILQMASIAVFSTDTFVILHYFGASALGKYSLVAKLFQTLPALAGVWFAPLWPAYAEALGRGDHAWVHRTLARSTLLSSAGCAIVGTSMALLARPLVLLWTGTDANPSAGLVTGLVLYAVLASGTGAVAAFLNGSNYIKGQVNLVLATAFVSVVLKIAFCRFGNVSGAIWGTDLAFVCLVIPAYLKIVPRLIRAQKTASIEGLSNAA